jgi:hypothetical protein
MKKLLRLLFLVALIVLGIWAWRSWFPDPRTAITNRLNKLARLASYSSQEGNIARVASIERMRAFFTKNVEVIVDVPGAGSHTFSDRDELMQAALSVRSAASSIQAQLIDLNIQLGPAGETAVVDLTLRAKVSDEVDAVVEDLNFTMKKISGDWMISRVQTIKTLKL